VELNLPPTFYPHLRPHLDRELVGPANEFMCRSSKVVRKRLVRAGFLLERPTGPSPMEETRIGALGDALEMIHSASLIIDDIQDGSPTRRGKESVHVLIGTAKAINVGNWLYFQGLQKVDEIGLDDRTTLSLLRLFRRALVEGHAGQALDLGVPISQADRALVPDICAASTRLKSGGLAGLAFAGGAILAGAEEYSRAFKTGESIGILLQSLDDLKNLKFDKDTPDKQFEDLRNQRPGLVWAAAASHERRECWDELLVALPNEAKIEAWLKEYQIMERERERVDMRLRFLSGRLQGQKEIEEVFALLVGAYEKL
jgi:geranylgeranyl pyrophosphate synthase